MTTTDSSLPKIHFKSLQNVRQYKCSSQSSKHRLTCTITHSLKVHADPVSRLSAHQCQVFWASRPVGSERLPATLPIQLGPSCMGEQYQRHTKTYSVPKKNAVLHIHNLQILSERKQLGKTHERGAGLMKIIQTLTHTTHN